MARFANRLAGKVTIYTNANQAVTSAIEAALSDLKPSSKTRKSISIDSRKIRRFTKGATGGEVIVHLEDGEKVMQGFLAHKPKGQLNGPFAEQLGLELTPQGDFKVNAPFGECSVPGVFAGGDSSTMMKAATFALYSGPLMAAGLAAQLTAED